MMGLEYIEIPSMIGKDETEILRVYESSFFPVPVKRVFTVTANMGAERGHHAHKKCTQILSCISGEVDLRVNDGSSIESVRLNTNNEAVLIPPGVWAEQSYVQDRSVLLVLCDYPYDEDDYIRDYDEYIEWKRKTT